MTLDQWDPRFLARSIIFEPLRIHGSALATSDWPTARDLQRVLLRLHTPPLTRSGVRLSFVPQAERAVRFEDKYEPRIYLKGEVQIRDRSWHDLLNALVWLTFPRAKAAINARHYHALRQQHARGAPNRGPAQDAMTLFDEGGVIVASRDPVLLRLIEARQWKALFWRERSRLVQHMRFHLFGHAIYEKALKPFTGITARGMLLEVDEEFLTLPLASQLQHIDGLAAMRLANQERITAPGDFPPVPILGVPGWCAENEAESYYDNDRYFRPRRTG
jgi:hypothetical protein